MPITRLVRKRYGQWCLRAKPAQRSVSWVRLALTPSGCGVIGQRDISIRIVDYYLEKKCDDCTNASLSDRAMIILCSIIQLLSHPLISPSGSDTLGKENSRGDVTYVNISCSSVKSHMAILKCFELVTHHKRRCSLNTPEPHYTVPDKQRQDPRPSLLKVKWREWVPPGKEVWVGKMECLNTCVQSGGQWMRSFIVKIFDFARRIKAQTCRHSGHTIDRRRDLPMSRHSLPAHDMDNAKVTSRIVA